MTRSDNELRSTESTLPGVRSVDLFRPHRGAGDSPRAETDWVGVEAPLELRLHGKPATVLLRTPGNDEELALGFLFHEGIIDRLDQVLALERPDEPGEPGDQVLLVNLSSECRNRGVERFFFSNSACGACGKNSLGALEVRGQPPRGQFQVDGQFLSQLLESMRHHQALFQRTGGVHGCGLFDTGGNLLALREDVGRHNALDKLTGHALLQKWLPLSERILALSGRVGYEMVQKAVVAGIPMIVAVGAPTSLAIEIADRFGITLVGFARGQSLNVYTHPHRLAMGQM